MTSLGGEKASTHSGGQQPDLSSSSFPPIADYAFLSDCETSCLIAPNGAVEWMGAPRPDSPSVFAAILDRAAGSFRLNPWGVEVPAARRYLPGSLMVETTWQARSGWLIVRDALTRFSFHRMCRTRHSARQTRLGWL